VFLPDTGLLGYFLGDTPQRLAAQPGLSGATVETFVLTELLKHCAFSTQGLSLRHYLTQTHIEVDFILENRLAQGKQDDSTSSKMRLAGRFIQNEAAAAMSDAAKLRDQATNKLRALGR